MLRITAVSAGAVDYLLKGSGCDPEKEAALEEAREHGATGYMAEAIGHGEPRGRWFGQGMEALGLSAEVGELADDADVRAVFGQLRRPGPEDRKPDYIGSKPRQYASAEERFERLKAEEPDATPERLEELESRAAGSARKAVAYYDLTFSPPKSVSVYWAALQAAGLHEEAEAVREAHDEAVRIAITYTEQHAAFTRLGDHGCGKGRARLGEFVQGTGLSVVVFQHSTNRENEPQLHTHAAVLNRVATVGPDGETRIGALDGKGFGPLKAAFATAYERAVEELVGEATGAVFETRADGKAREIVGVDAGLMDKASTRRAQVLDRVEGLIAAYVDKHDREPDAAARKALADVAAMQTRAAKGDLSGPAGVTAWGRTHAEWCEAVVDQVDAAALAVATERVAGHRNGHDRMATPERVAELHAERVAEAVAAGIADVQARTATWTLGGLVAGIDRHLGRVDEVGVSARERPAFLEQLARDAVASGHDVVQLTGHEPVAVPSSLLRPGDGRPVFRPHADERYATAAHLAAEERVVALARAHGAPALDLPGREAVAARLVELGLSDDQRAAVLGVLSSGRGADVLIGPAGAGKSRTVEALGEAWTGHVSPGGRVYAVATSQIATANLERDGLTAVNTSRFLAAVTPDPVTGNVRDPIRPGDLVVVDEAGMSSTGELEQITRLVSAAGGKVLFTGDHHQLDAVGAGGLFAFVAERVDPEQRHELATVHRFTNDWERDASLRLREGDHDVIREYQHHGRLATGSLDEMAAEATRNYLADTVAGRRSLLIVGSNDQAATLSQTVQTEMAALGLLGDVAFERIADGNSVRVGDRVQARQNDRRIMVERDEHGHARPVTNRESYTVIGRAADETLLVRDDRGAVAHLPAQYVRDHLVLGYATTVHGAQGLTVDTSHALLDRDASREAAYVALTRAVEANLAYLITEREPDHHEPERIAELTVERMAAVLDRVAAEPAASIVLEDADLDLASLSSVAARIEIVAGMAARDRARDALADVLTPEDAARLHSESERAARDRLDRAVHAAELAGHDATTLIRRAAEMTELSTAESVGDVLRWRVNRLTATTEPTREAAAGRWDRVVDHGQEPDPDRARYLAHLAELAELRQAHLGAEAALAQPTWVRALGDVPDPELDPAGRAEWERRAGVVAAYREVAGISPERESIGAPPARERVLDRAMWEAALHAGGPERDPAVRDWREASDEELTAARQAWATALQQAPEWVADDLEATSKLARTYAMDAALDRAAAEHAGADTEQGRDLVDLADRGEVFAEHHQARAAELEAAYQARSAWWAEHTGLREADSAAVEEMARRGVVEPEQTAHRPVPDIEPEPELPAEPEPEPAPEAEPDRGWAWDRFSADLRAQHGDRLDPDKQMSPDDLAHARAREIADERARQAPAPVSEQAETQEPVQTAQPDLEAARDAGAAAERDRAAEKTAELTQDELDISQRADPALEAEPELEPQLERDLDDGLEYGD